MSASERRLLLLLKAELQYAVEVFDETCDCGRCGPCKRKPRMRAIVTQAKNATNP